MTTQTQPTNGHLATLPVDPVQEALATLIKSAGQTNQLLQDLAGEMRVMNRQLFDGRTQPPSNSPQRGENRFASPPAGGIEGGRGPQAGNSWDGSPVATIVPDGQRPRKQIIKSTCAQIGITKTLSLSKWKLNFYVDGEGRPASAYARRKGEFASLIQRARGVWPEISPDHFSNETWTQRNKEWQAEGQEGNYEELFIAPEPFMVEWYEQVAQGNGKTYAYIERVYPCPPVG